MTRCYFPQKRQAATHYSMLVKQRAERLKTTFWIRFWKKVDKFGPIPAHKAELGNCWVWTGHSIKGYGAFGKNGKQECTHRLSWELANGSIPDGLYICHRCDNRLCCNPSHLFCGTHTDNMNDMMNKQRQARGKRARWFGAYGSKNPHSKLTDNQANTIIAMNREGASQRAIARKFGISKSTVGCVVSGKTWPHIDRK